MSDDDAWLSTAEVAEQLRLTPRQVRNIPRDRLPYEESAGGSERGGRRSYRRSHVDAYRRGPAADHEARIADLERRVGDVERRLEQ